MHLSAFPATARDLVRHWALRREIVPFLPALLLGGLWFGGEMVLVIAAVMFPAIYALWHGRTSSAPGLHPRDGVTGLPLRSALIEQFDRVFSGSARSGTTTAAFAIGIDDFAEIEYRHGLHAAEMVLRRVGERVALTLRGTDIVARVEHDVFGAGFGPVTRIDLETAIQTAARIQAAVRQPIQVDDARLHVTCSIGFCLGGRAPRPTGEAVLGAALEALAEARAAGAGSIRAFVAARLREVGTREALDAEAVAALESGQIRPWFQPQISTDTGEVSGFEALARWEHPERGVIAPNDFLPALAAAGVLDRLGEVILYHSLTALQAWDRAGVRVPAVGVNFSAEELRNPRLAERLKWELDRFDLAPDRLAVEILETVVADTSDDSITRTITTLAQLGCRIDLDDFGTGYASLAALKRFSVNRIKIDRSFVINVDEDREQQTMVEAILGMAERLKLETLAEGVERVGEHSMLAQLGCGHVQGFGIARAMPFEDTIGWMARHAQKLANAPEVARRVV